MPDDNISATLDGMIEKYGKYVFGVVRYFLYGEPHETHEEIYQEVWMRVCRGFEKFEARSKISTYLYVIAKNTVFSFLEKKKRERTESLEELKVEPRAAMRDEALRLTLKAAIDGLGEDEQKLLLYKYTLDMSCREIAEEMSLSEDNVKQKLLRLRRRMREALGDCF